MHVVSMHEIRLRIHRMKIRILAIAHHSEHYLHLGYFAFVGYEAFGKVYASLAVGLFVVTLLAILAGEEA